MAELLVPNSRRVISKLVVDCCAYLLFPQERAITTSTARNPCGCIRTHVNLRATECPLLFLVSSLATLSCHFLSRPALPCPVRAATDALERCRAQAEKSADRTTAAVDAWLAERRRRWEAGKTRCQELAPPPPPPPRARSAAGAEEGEAVAEAATIAATAAATALLSEGHAFGGGEADAHPAEGGTAAVGVQGAEGVASGGPGGGKGWEEGKEEEEAEGASSWNWEREAGRGAGFDDFFETFAGGAVGDWDEDGAGEAPERPLTGGTAS